MPYYVGGKEFSSSALAESYARQTGQSINTSGLASPSDFGHTITTTYPGGNPYYKGSTSWGGATFKSNINSAIQKAMAYYQQGGGFGKGVEAALERGRTKALASGGQSLVSAGLAGTSMMAGLGKKFEEEVAVPTRLSVEEKRAEALANLEMGGAQMMQGAYESQANRDLQMYLAQLQNRPSVSPITQQPVYQPYTKTEEPSYKFPTAPSLISSSGYLGIPGVSSIPPEKMPVMGYTTEELKKYERLGW